MEEQLARVTNYVVANYLGWLIVPIIVLTGYLVIRTTDKYVARFFDQVEYDRTLEILFQKTIKIFLWIVVLILALANIGFDVSGFLAGLGVMGFIVGFAVKDVLSNLAARMFLLVKRPFKVGGNGQCGRSPEQGRGDDTVLLPHHHRGTAPRDGSKRQDMGRHHPKSVARGIRTTLGRREKP